MTRLSQAFHNKFVKGKQKSGRELFYEQVYFLMKETSLSFDEICSMPMPCFLKLLNVMEEDYKKQAEANKKASKR